MLTTQSSPCNPGLCCWSGPKSSPTALAWVMDHGPRNSFGTSHQGDLPPINSFLVTTLRHLLLAMHLLLPRGSPTLQSRFMGDEISRIIQDLQIVATAWCGLRQSLGLGFRVTATEGPWSCWMVFYWSRPAGSLGGLLVHSRRSCWVG